MERGRGTGDDVERVDLGSTARECERACSRRRARLPSVFCQRSVNSAREATLVRQLSSKLTLERRRAGQSIHRFTWNGTAHMARTWLIRCRDWIAGEAGEFVVLGAVAAKLLCGDPAEPGHTGHARHAARAAHAGAHARVAQPAEARA